MSPISVSEPFSGRGNGDAPRDFPSPNISDKAVPNDYPSVDPKPDDEYVTVVVGAEIQPDASSEPPRAMYSTLPSLSNEPQFTTMRKGHKVMVGHNGWLDRPECLDKKPSPPKKGRILDTLKRMAKEVVRREKRTRWHGIVYRSLTNLLHPRRLKQPI